MSNVLTGNLVKSYFLQRDEMTPRVIDGNSLVIERIEKLKSIMPELVIPMEVEPSEPGEFSEGIDAAVLDVLMGDSDAVEGEEPQSNIIKAVPEAPAVPVYEGPSPEEILEEARVEAEAIKVEARKSIERARVIGHEEGLEQGYNEGKQAAMAELEVMRRELEEERAVLERDYESRIAELEPRFVHTLTGIYEKIFEVDLSSHKEIIMALLRNTMTDIGGSKSYLVHVSREDYEYVSSHRAELNTDSVLEGAVIDIVEDATLKANDCMIETVNGIFDCSLGTELAGLRARLELLSTTIE